MGIANSKGFPYPVRLEAEKLEYTALANCTDLASAALGGKVITQSDQFFGTADNLLKSRPPRKPEDELSNDAGTTIDGWETARHNKDHDHVVIKLGYQANIIGFDIDTTNFEEDCAAMARVEACFIEEDVLKKTGEVDTNWKEILPAFTLIPNSHNFFGLPLSTQIYNFVRLSIYPDGGIARFRCYGTVAPRVPTNLSNHLIDLASIGIGGRIVSVSSDPRGKVGNLLWPGRGANTGDGWETPRSRRKGHRDWVVIKLGIPGKLEKAEIDTYQFKGNYPESAKIEASYSETDDEYDMEWVEVMPRYRLAGHQQQAFPFQVRDKAFTHVRLTIFPDGGVKRVRIYGRPVTSLTESTLTTEPTTLLTVKSEIIDPPTSNAIPRLQRKPSSPLSMATSFFPVSPIFKNPPSLGTEEIANRTTKPLRTRATNGLKMPRAREHDSDEEPIAIAPTVASISTPVKGKKRKIVPAAKSTIKRACTQCVLSDGGICDDCLKKESL